MKKLRGSLTIESALVMPIFVIAISILIFWTSFLQTQEKLNAEAADKAREMAKLAYLTEEEGSNRLIEIAKGELLNGIYFERLAVARPFTGSCYDEAEGGSAEDNRIVYIAKTGEVYHTSNICSHISLSVKQVGYSDVNKLRNKGGAKYYPCEYCARGKIEGQVYITEEGNRIHRSKKCPGIKRTIIEMKKIDAEGKGYRPCERCGRIHD